MSDANEIVFQALVDTIVDGVIMIDDVGRIMLFNVACEKMFGYQADEVMGKNVSILMPQPYRVEHDGYLKNYHESGTRKIIGIGREVSAQCKDGHVFPINLSVGEVKQADGVYFVGILHDLTSRKKTEQQLVQAQKMEVVGQLSGGIAHDFNNLLTVIIGHAEVLSEKLNVRPDLRKMADNIITAGERGAELTRRLLVFSRRQTLSPVRIDCNKLILEMQHILRRTLREDIRINVILEDGLRPALADQTQLESAILNLALNAQDAMPQGGSLTISTSYIQLDEDYQAEHQEVRAGEYVFISVTDDGEGMTAEVKSRVFEPFFTTKEAGKGSGLGLSMVYGFIKQSNGHVSIYSEVGLGTSVRLYLPVADKNTAVGDNAEKDMTPLRGGRETVLLVEDDAYVQSYAISLLESLGYKVITASDGHDALQKLEGGQRPDIMFSDVVMPGGMSGAELARRARAVVPGLKVLLTSGYPMETLGSKHRIEITDQLLHKPYRKAELARRLREILDA